MNREREREREREKKKKDRQINSQREKEREERIPQDAQWGDIDIMERQLGERQIGRE